MLRIFVEGEPKPQGSKSGFIRGNRVVLVEANKSLPGWRNTLESALKHHWADQEAITEAVSIELTFWLTRPATNRREAMTTKPDLDKLCRAVFDCAVRAGIVKDDALVVDLVASKHYADENRPGVLIELSRIDNK